MSVPNTEQPPGISAVEPTSIEAARAARVAGLPTLRVAERVVTIPLSDVYDGMEFVAWVNYPPALRDEFQKNDQDARLGALRKIVRSTNFKDTNGNPFPDPSTEDFWLAIPDDLAILMIRAVVAQVGSLSPTNVARS